MDTIQLKLLFNQNVMWDYGTQKFVVERLQNIKSRFNFRYCDVLEISNSTVNSIIVKLSYPRYYYGNNAYLITQRSEALEVQQNFVLSVSNELNGNNIYLEAVEVTRVDIPFTYIMPINKSFKDYSNVFKVIGLIFCNTYTDVRPKAIIDLITENKETVIYTDTLNMSSYNKKVTIYNQYLNLSHKYQPQDMKRIEQFFPNVIKRMRIEMSTRIRRKAFSSQEFRICDIYSHYLLSYKEYN